MKNDHDAAVEAAVAIIQSALDGRYAPDDPKKLVNVIVLALNGVEPAHRALCGYAVWLTDKQEPLPHALQLYMIEAASEGFKAKKKHKNLERDLAICIAVRELVPAGYPATRNMATTQTPSACSLVAEALARINIHMSEDAVDKIRQRKGELVLMKPPLLS